MNRITLPLALLVLAATVASAPAKSPPKKAADPAPPDCATKGPLPESWSGQAFAIDGDTLAGAGLKPNIRIWGIQAAELRDKQTGQETVAGMRARAALEDLLDKSGHKVKCQATKFDRYCRIVAQCSLDAGADSIDIGSSMIGAGLAYGFYLDETLPFEPRASQRYANIELDARKSRRGLWKEWLGEK